MTRLSGGSDPLSLFRASIYQPPISVDLGLDPLASIVGFSGFDMACNTL